MLLKVAITSYTMTKDDANFLLDEIPLSKFPSYFLVSTGHCSLHEILVHEVCFPLSVHLINYIILIYGKIR